MCVDDSPVNLNPLRNLRGQILCPHMKLLTVNVNLPLSELLTDSVRTQLTFTDTMWLYSSTWAVLSIPGCHPLTLTASEVNFTEWYFRFIASADIGWVSAFRSECGITAALYWSKRICEKNVILNLPQYSNKVLGYCVSTCVCVCVCVCVCETAGSLKSY